MLFLIVFLLYVTSSKNLWRAGRNGTLVFLGINLIPGMIIAMITDKSGPVSVLALLPFALLEWPAVPARTPTWCGPGRTNPSGQPLNGPATPAKPNQTKKTTQLKPNVIWILNLHCGLQGPAPRINWLCAFHHIDRSTPATPTDRLIRRAKVFTITRKRPEFLGIS